MSVEEVLIMSNKFFFYLREFCSTTAHLIFILVSFNYKLFSPHFITVLFIKNEVRRCSHILLKI